MRFLISIMIVSMAIILGASLMPAIEDAFTTLRDGDNFNCENAPEYNVTAETNTLGCTVTGIGAPFILLGIIFGGIAYILYGRSEQPTYQ